MLSSTAQKEKGQDRKGDGDTPKVDIENGSDPSVRSLGVFLSRGIMFVRLFYF